MLGVKWSSSSSAMFTFHITFLVSFVTGVWYNTHYTTWDILGMMKNLGLGCANSTQPCPSGCSGEGRLCFRKVESLQASFCYMRTVHIVPQGSHTPRKWVTCSVSVAKKGTCILPGWNSCFYRLLQKMCKWKRVFLHLPAWKTKIPFPVWYFCKSHLHPGSWFVACCSESVLIWCSTSEYFSVHLHSWFW